MKSRKSYAIILLGAAPERPKGEKRYGIFLQKLPLCTGCNGAVGAVQLRNIHQRDRRHMLNRRFLLRKIAFFHNVALLILGVFLIALAAFLYFFLYRKKVPELAEKQTQQNIRTKADAAYIYCQRCPEAYDELRAINPAFAQKYERSETGKIVKTRR